MTRPLPLHWDETLAQQAARKKRDQDYNDWAESLKKKQELEEWLRTVGTKKEQGGRNEQC